MKDFIKFYIIGSYIIPLIITVSLLSGFWLYEQGGTDKECWVFSICAAIVLSFIFYILFPKKRTPKE